MSGHLVIIPARAVTDQRVSPAAFRVLSALGSHTDRAGWCRVKQDTIAALLGASRQAVSKQLLVLEELGYVGVVRTGRSSRYRVLLDVPDECPIQPDVVSPDCPMQPGVASDATSEVASDSTPRGCIDRTSVLNVVPERTEALPALNGTSSFQRFWATYPRREGKGAAEKAWAKALRHATDDLILDGARRYRDDPNRDPAFTAHPSTWLNQKRWEDDPLPARSTTTASVGDRGLLNFIANHTPTKELTR